DELDAAGGDVEGGDDRGGGGELLHGASPWWGGRAVVARAVSDEGKATLRSKFRQALHCVKTLFPQVNCRISLQWL
ncbi:hypothetical protein ACFY8X_16020, partial [Streptomyces tanashiensis]|uniref:hypothetical protein n=1 Tax=Streptomyces tanashiensis TaxID=67367 RepID=UPI0036E1EDFD